MTFCFLVHINLQHYISTYCHAVSNNNSSADDQIESSAADFQPSHHLMILANQIHCMYLVTPTNLAYPFHAPSPHYLPSIFLIDCACSSPHRYIKEQTVNGESNSQNRTRPFLESNKTSNKKPSKSPSLFPEPPKEKEANVKKKNNRARKSTHSQHPQAT